MKIGVLLICVGKYDIFFDELYETCENLFLNGHDKTYYVFTDSEKIIEKHNVIKIKQNNLGWPYNTLKRFEMFNSISDKLITEDYLYFFNANMKINMVVGDEIIPKEEHNFLMGVNHPAFYNADKSNFTYERRPESRFYIGHQEGITYFQGCFNGGRSIEFLEMSRILDDMINIDLKNDIMPIWHDESALNWYYKDRTPLVLNSGYSYPEGWSLPFEQKILQKNKHNYGGHDYLRN
jgi:hypothetical protein